jgi:oligoendopeptidase F
MEAYAAFAPEMAEIARPFFASGLDRRGREAGKAPGAFAHPHGDHRASLCDAELSGQAARRDDPGA